MFYRSTTQRESPDYFFHPEGPECIALTLATALGANTGASSFGFRVLDSGRLLWCFHFDKDLIVFTLKLSQKKKKTRNQKNKKRKNETRRRTRRRRRGGKRRGRKMCAERRCVVNVAVCSCTWLPSVHLILKPLLKLKV